MAPPPQLSVEPKVPFLRSLAHFAFAATSLARPRGFLARHGRSPRQRCWPPSIPQKLLPQQGAARAFANRNARRERAPRERALRSRTTRPCPPIIVRVTDGGERSIGDRKPVGRRPSAGRGQCPTDKVDEGELESERAPWCDGGSAKVGCPQRERAWEWNFAPLFSRGAEIPASASPLPRVRFDRGAPRGRERLKKSAFRLVFPQLRPLPSLPPVTSPCAAAPPHRLFAEVVEPTPGAPNQRGSGEGIGPPSLSPSAPSSTTVAAEFPPKI